MDPSMSLPSLFTPGLVAVAVIFPVLSTAAVALRFYVHQTGSISLLHTDDWIAFLALIFCWGHSINTLVGAGVAGVTTIKASPITGTIAIGRAIWIEGLLLATGVYVVKMSILHFYLRIFPTKFFRVAVAVLYSALTGWWISSIACQFSVIDPIYASWNPALPFTYRFDYDAWAVSFAALSILFDVTILVYPVPMIHRLHMSNKKKISVLGVFWLGAFCVVAAVVRLIYLNRSIKGVQDSQAADPYMDLTHAFYWAHIEPNASLVAACLPTYGPLFKEGRSMYSFFQSMRSRFSLSSLSRRSSGQPSKVLDRDSSGRNITGSNNSAGGYYELRADPTNISSHTYDHSEQINSVNTVIAQTDLEAQHLPPNHEGIDVVKSYDIKYLSK